MSPEPIAIIGMACRFPGAPNIEAFWRLLHEGVDAIRPIDREGLDPARFYDARPRTPGRMTTRFAGMLDNLEQFDADFFGIAPREAEKLDPAQRILLETAWEACEDAGVDVATLSGRPVGVFVGQWTSDFETRLFADLDTVDFHATSGTGRYAAAGRLSYILGLTGPSMSLDTACSSSLVAVHLACQSLRSGETPLAFAAGVNVMLQPHITIAYSQSGMMSPEGKCKFGDADGDGYVRSEGVGMLLLKRLSDALADGDTIHAVIRGSAVNNDGRLSGLLGRPSREGQAIMLETAYASAGVSPGDVSYVEAHGTGTRVGDPVELGALADVIGVEREPGSQCYVGSVKTNIGHTEGAAGMAGLIKCILAFEHEEIPASLHLRTPNPKVPWSDVPFKIPQQAVAWPRSERARIAGVTGFGIAGTNAHVVLEEAPVQAQHAARREVAGPLPLVLSAATPAALRALAGAYADLLTSPDAPSITDLCASAALHRSSLAERAVFIATERDDLLERLRRFAAGDEQAANVARRAEREGRRRIAFVFPGQGGQWLGMARELLANDARFAEVVARCDAALPRGTSWTVREQLLAEPNSKSYRMNEIGVLQPVLVVVEIALAEMWRSLGVEPEAVVGHSMGEVGAAYFAGALSLEDAMRVICERSRLLQRTSGAGAMAMLELSSEETAQRIAGYGDRLCVAVVNGPRSTVISGDPSAVAEVRAECEREGIFCRAVQVDVASHSPQMDPLVPELRAAVKDVDPQAAVMALYSTVDAARMDGAKLDASYWGRNLRSTVQFASATERMLEDGIDAFIEVSPHPALLVSVAQVAGARPQDENTRKPIAIGSLRRNEAERANLLTSFGALWAAGHSVDWSRVFARDSYTRVSLPSYPWQRERLWPTLSPVGEAKGAKAAQPALDEAHRDWLYVSRWVASAASGNDVPRRWVLAGPDTRELQALNDVLVARGATAVVVKSIGDAARAIGDNAGETGIVVLADPHASHLAWQSLETLRTLQNAHRGGSVPRVWWVTRGAHRVAGEPVSAQAAELGGLWGAVRVLGTEHPDWWGGLVDLDASAPMSAQADALAAHLTATRGDDQVAIRGGARYALRLQRADAALGSRPATQVWRADGAYLITGGFGGVAQQLARQMVRDGARRLVLVGRTPLPPRSQWNSVSPTDPAAGRIAFVRELEHAGASVHALAADAGDETQLAAAVAAYNAEGWPAIVGVIHAAGALDSRLTGDMDADAFDRVVHPKLDAAIVLDRIFPQLDVFVLISSMMAFWAPESMANYAAANAGLDALAVSRRARGQHAVSIEWGPWESLGLYRATADGATADLARDGVSAFTGTEGAQFLAPLVAAKEPVIAVVSINWDTFAATRRGREPSIFRDLLAQRSDDGGTVKVSNGLRAQLAGVSELTRHSMIEGAVRNALAAVLRRSPGQVDARQPFGTMGLDSLMALELRNRLESAIERSLPATIAWNYPTITQLSAHLDTLIGDVSPAADHPPSAIDVTEPVPEEPAGEQQDARPSAPAAFAMENLFSDVAQLSDEDIARALRGG